LNQDSISLEILKHIGVEPGITSKLLEERVKLSRAPVLSRTKKLYDDKLTNRRALPGTERNSKPALIYSLPADVSLLAIECALKKLPLDKYLKLEKGQEDRAPEIQATHLPAVDDLKRVLTLAVQRIVELESRLTRLEYALTQSDGFDINELLVMLQSQNPQRS
jgi:DNA-binding Lrp family transcriptional regulator